MPAPTYRRPPTGQIDDAAADFGETVSRLDPVSGKGFVDFAMAANTSFQYAPHSLGRAYRGAIVVGQESLNTVIVVHPRNKAIALDPERRVCVLQSTATPQTIRLLVF